MQNQIISDESNKDVSQTSNEELEKDSLPQREDVLSNGEAAVDEILSLENMINGYIFDLNKLQKDLKEQSAMLKDTFENDAEYQAAQEKAKEVAKLKKQVKDRLSGEPSVALLSARVQDLKSESKEIKQALSDYLYRYYKETGLTQITATDGEVLDIVTSVRLVKKKD